MDDNWELLESRIAEPFLLIPDVFLPEELGEIRSLLGHLETEPGVTWEGAGFAIAPERRRVATSFVPRSAQNEWLYARIDKVFFAAAKYWGFDVRKTTEDLKYCEYRTGDHFQQWHADVGVGYTSRRKISISVELSAPEEYEGGELELFPEVKISSETGRRAGSATVFPSHRYHRARPVTDGVRRVLINWISGPPLT